MSDEDYAIIGKKAELKHISKNDVLFLEGEPVKFLFILEEGGIKLSNISEDGRELIIRVMKPRDYFCCAPLLTGGKSLVDATAIDDSTIITIPCDYFLKILFKGTNEISKKVITTLCSKIEHLSNIIKDITFKDVEHRIILSLLKLVEERVPEDNEVTLKVTHQVLASMAGTAREVVSRTLLRLRKEGVITDANPRSIGVNKERLVRFLSGKTATSRFK